MLLHLPVLAVTQEDNSNSPENSTEDAALHEDSNNKLIPRRSLAHLVPRSRYQLLIERVFTKFKFSYALYCMKMLVLSGYVETGQNSNTGCNTLFITSRLP